MALTDAERLRQMLGESIRPSETDQDTLFLEREIDDFLARAAALGRVGDKMLEAAAFYGWRAKSAALSNMTDVQEGTSREALSKLHLAALEEAKSYGVLTGLAPGESRQVRMGRVVRR